jgi:hypothetical protein
VRPPVAGNSGHLLRAGLEALPRSEAHDERRDGKKSQANAVKARKRSAAARSK